MSDLYLSELLVHNIKLCRENDTFESHKADIADALCGVIMAMDEVTTPRVQKLLEIARDVSKRLHDSLLLIIPVSSTFASLNLNR